MKTSINITSIQLTKMETLYINVKNSQNNHIQVFKYFTLSTYHCPTFRQYKHQDVLRTINRQKHLTTQLFSDLIVVGRVYIKWLNVVPRKICVRTACM